MDIEDKVVLPTTLSGYLTSAKESIGVFIWVWKHLQTPKQKSWLRKMLTFLTLNTLCQASLPFAISVMVNGLEGEMLGKVLTGTFATILIVASQKYFHHHQGKCREWVIGCQQSSLDDYITKMMFEKSLGQHTHHSSALNVANIDKGRWKLLDLQNVLLYEGFQVLLTLSISSAFLLIISPVSGGVLFLSFLVYMGWTIFLNHKVVLECTAIDKRARRLNRKRLERWEKVERVKTSGKAEDERFGMSVELESIMVEDRKFWMWYIGQNSFRDTATAIAYITIVCFGAWKVWHHRMPIGNFFPIITWTSAIVGNIWQVGRIEHLINWNMPTVKAKIEALTIVPDAVNSPGAVVLDSTAPVAMSFKNVSYTYPEKSVDDYETDDEVPQALMNVSFDVLEGESVAILGRSGAGKSTLLKLSLRSMDPTSGQIIVNDVDLRELDYLSWMRAIGYIPQHPQIFDGSVRYNLTYGLSKSENESLSDEAVWDLMKDLQIDFGKRLTNGLETEVGNNGIKLSGGQAQRVIIGAAAMKKPRIMMIDEATSSLDSTTEKLVQAGLAKVLSGNVTALVIAHRLSTVRHLCNKFVVLSNTDELKPGDSQVEAVASSFEELYILSPTFRSIADDQGLKF